MAEPRLRRNVSRNIPTISLNERPLFMQNGHRSFSISDAAEINGFRRALPQFIAVSVKNILLFVYGMTLGFPTIVIPAIQGGEGREPSDIVLNRDEISWFSSINLICVPLGCLFSGLLTQPLGKRKAMQFVNLPILASWLLFHFSTRTEHLYAALCLSGLGGGLMEAPVLTYVAEITEPKYRGILSALGSTCVIAGVFIQFIMGSLMDWRTIAAVSSAFPVISIIALCFVPESPHWLIREQRFREAIKALQWLRGWVPEYKIESEFNRLYDELITKPAMEEAAEIAADGKTSKCRHWFRMFRKRSFLVPFLLVAYTFFAGHFSGKTSLQTYAVQIFHTLKAPINKYHATILLGVAEMIATILCVFLIHFTGKRPLVLLSTIGVGCCFFGTATYAHYLKIVPGFAINNVIVKADSSIVAKESIISQDNITKIFETEQQALLLAADVLRGERNELQTTTMYTTPMDSETTTLTSEEQLMIVNRQKRQDLPLDTLNDSSTYPTDLSSLDYPETGKDDKINKTLLDLYDDSDEAANEQVPPVTTTLMPEFEDAENILQKQQEKATKTIGNDKLPSTKQVVDDILLPVPKQPKNNLVWLPLILLLGSAFFAHLGIRMIPWILIGEVFPAQVRSTASGLVSGLGYIFGFLANKLFLQMLATLTLPGTFWFYSAVALSATVILYFTLPETEGRTLGEIEAHFSKKSDTNLLKKFKESNTSNNDTKTTLQLDNLQHLQMPVQLQIKQSDLVTRNNLNRTSSGGATNLAFEAGNSTTHL